MRNFACANATSSCHRIVQHHLFPAWLASHYRIHPFLKAEQPESNEIWTIGAVRSTSNFARGVRGRPQTQPSFPCLCQVIDAGNRAANPDLIVASMALGSLGPMLFFRVRGKHFETRHGIYEATPPWTAWLAMWEWPNCSVCPQTFHENKRDDNKVMKTTVQ